MQRVNRKLSTAIVLLLLSAAATPLAAEASVERDQKTAYLINRQKELFAGIGTNSGCHTITAIDEIVVCGRGIDRRVRTIASPEAGGPPQLRIVAPPNGSVGASVTITGCFLQKCPKKFVLIDLSTIPEAPQGSDADLIARGLMRDR